MAVRSRILVAATCLMLVTGACQRNPGTIDGSPTTREGVDSGETLAQAGSSEQHRGSDLRILPETPTLKPGDTAIQLIVAELQDDSRKDLTTVVEWEVEPPGIVAVEQGGYARVRGTGQAKVYALRDGQRIAEETITVEGSSDGVRPWDFSTDIVPILTRNSCNTGGCHGRADGQNGFRLSLFGYDPEGDYRSISRGSGGRRLDRVVPEASLLFLKSTGAVPHGGGPRLLPGSDDYQTLLAWIKAGAPRQLGVTHGDLTTVRIEPSSLALDGPGSGQLRVVALYEDGHQRDVTRLSTFRSNDDSAADVDQNGLARLLRRAETDLIVRYQSQVIAVRIGSPINADLDFDFAALPRQNFIDSRLFERLERLNVPPSPPADDASFLRRVSLDLTGQLPRPEEVRAFLRDTAPEKRVRKVEELMGRRDFLLFWMLKLGDRLQITSNRFPGAGRYQSWLRQRLNENAPWNEMVVELLTATGNPMAMDGGAANYALDGVDAESRAEATAQRFLGIRLRCARCHDHPFDVWTQDDYYGLAAFFAKVQYGDPRMLGEMMSMTAGPAVTVNPDGQLLHLRTQEVVTPRLLDGTPVELDPDDDPRKALAEWLTHPENASFARATANWVWAQFFGRGLADPADDLSAANPPVHPELLDALARHFVETDFDLRSLIHTITTSNAYGLSSQVVPGNESDQRLFSHHLARPLTAHQMADALAHATDVPNVYPQGHEGDKAIEIFDPATASTILDTFGRCPRTTGCAAVTTPSLSLRQALLLVGGGIIDSKVANLNGYLDNSLEYGISPDDLVENLYLRTVCRYPNDEERSFWVAELKGATSLREVAEDLFWALLNSREFSFNH